MEWLEMIRVRVAGTKAQNLARQLLEQVEGALREAGLLEARIYAHASVPNDLLITLAWSSVPPQSWGSDLAHALSEEFKRAGLVDHSVWIQWFAESRREAYSREKDKKAVFSER